MYMYTYIILPTQALFRTVRAELGMQASDRPYTSQRSPDWCRRKTTYSQSQITLIILTVGSFHFTWMFLEYTFYFVYNKNRGPIRAAP